MNEHIPNSPAEAFKRVIDTEAFQGLLQLALQEDIGSGDVTSNYFIEADRQARAFVVSRQSGVLAGSEVAAAVFHAYDPDLQVNVMLASGSKVASGALVLEVKGSARSILTAERTALNFIQRLSGIATLTARFVAAVEGSSTRILDTRKTTPGFRLLEKAAVIAGGGRNHRLGLYDRAMIKDNHLLSSGDLARLQADILRLRAEKPGVEVEVEADSLEQVERFLTLEGVDYLLLDNMSCEEMRAAVELRGGAHKPLLEASGGVNLESIGAIAATGVDFVSIGALTHSAGSLDLALDFA